MSHAPPQQQRASSPVWPAQRASSPVWPAQRASGPCSMAGYAPDVRLLPCGPGLLAACVPCDPPKGDGEGNGEGKGGNGEGKGGNGEGGGPKEA
eukprot:5368004-Prymnesium_polylepis.1